MKDVKKLFLFLAVAALFASGITATVPVFADDDDGEDDEDDKKKDKTLRQICKKQAGKDNFKGLVCEALFKIKGLLNALNEKVTVNMMAIIDLEEKVDNISTGGIISNTQSFHETATSLVGVSGDIPGLAKTITVDSDAKIFITTNLHTEGGGFGIFSSRILVDGDVKSKSLAATSTAGGLLPYGISYSGAISAGTHTIKVDVFDLPGAIEVCIIPDLCHMDILVLEE